MKNSIILFAACLLLFAGCKKEEDVDIPEEVYEKVEIPFEGVWQREFDVVGNTHTVSYFIYQDSIRYTLTGSVGQANYLMQRDEFLLDNNRFIGHTSAGQHYLIFVKDVTDNAITLYKQEISGVEEGLNMIFPNDSTSANYGWNTYQK